MQEAKQPASLAGAEQSEQEGQMGRSAAPPAFGFADDVMQRQEAPDTGGGAGVAAGAGAAAGGAVAAGAAEKVSSGGGDLKGKIDAALGAKASETDPPNKLVKANDNVSNKVNDDIKGELASVVSTVSDLTGIDIGTGFGDTSRRLAGTTSKDGADNFSWHKTGRAIDFNQGLKWVIMKNPDGGDMFFRLYLKANQQGPGEGEKAPAEGAEWKHPSGHAKKFNKKADAGNVHHNGAGSSLYSKWFIDVTSILTSQGFERIPAHKGWEKSYNRREWWHYVKDDGLTWYKALRQIYSEADLVKGIKSFATRRHQDAGRLSREGFPDTTLQAIWDKTEITKNGFPLYFSVGSHRDCANIMSDIAGVRMGLNELGIPLQSTEEMIVAFQKKEKFGTADGYITVGGTTHKRIGQRLQEKRAKK